jgi:hypothetical protein
MNGSLVEINRASLEIDKLADPQPVQRRHLDHQPISVATAIAFRGAFSRSTPPVSNICDASCGSVY